MINGQPPKSLRKAVHRISSMFYHVLSYRVTADCFKIKNLEPTFLLGPPVPLARWAHMHRFLSVCRPSGLDQKS